jgi:lipoprotein-anchoring transpeptidase ErfK/SrfK
MLAGATVRPSSRAIGSHARSGWKPSARRAGKNTRASLIPRSWKVAVSPTSSPEAPDIVTISTDEKPGTIIVDTEGRRLFYVLENKRAYKYPISVGRDGFTWTGTERISRVQAWPTWTPPASMRQRQPYLPRVVKGGVINPLGAKALYLGSSIYRIHGTNNKRSIGRASSSGCFRMMNKHVLHLATLAKVGTRVKVVKRYAGRVGSANAFAGWFQ